MGEEFKGGIINSVVCTSEAVEKIIMAVFPGIKKKKSELVNRKLWISNKTVICFFLGSFSVLRNSLEASQNFTFFRKSGITLKLQKNES